MELKELLKQVSRSFYLTMVVLPRSVRGQISIAYLLARATDTIADTELINVDSRIQTLFKLRNIILEEKSPEFSFPEEAVSTFLYELKRSKERPRKINSWAFFYLISLNLVSEWLLV